MPLRRGFQGRNQSRPRRLTAWGSGPNSTGQPISSETTVIWSNGVVLVSEVKATIVRIRGLFSFYIESGDAISAGFSGAIGIGLVSNDAFAASAVPDAGVDVDWPGWIYHRFFDARVTTATIADGVNAATVKQQFEIDSKAMRKWGPQETLFGNIQTTAESGVATARFFADTRLLIKLS